ncbi:MATE family efflux transporter [Agathobaculum sp.]|uniref:MATE family efflux transporter n=1 Tax=Agathobaculum sp. TaxID=2048138 RepID=UPI003AEF4D75
MANPENKIEKDIQNEIPKENKMGVMPVGKLLFTMSLPIMISMLVQALYNVVDSMFVARVSENALTALSIAFPIQNLMIAVSVGLGVGLNAVVSRALGAKDTKGVNRAATNGIMLMFICGLIFMLGGATLVRPYFEMQTDIEEIVTSGIDYTSIVMMGSMGVFMQILFERLLQSTGRTMLTMFSQGVGAIINIIFDPIFIFGYFGFPKMGVAGAAYATILGQWVAALLGLILNIRKNPEVSISMKGFKPHGATIRLILSIGIPSVVMQSIGSVMTFLMNQILIAFSSTAVAVFGVYFKLQSFVFMPVFGLTNGTVPIVAYNFGARKGDRMKKTIQYSVYAAIVIMICGALIFQSIPDKLLMLFDASDEMLRVGVPALRIISLSFPLAGFGIGAGAVFQALGFSVYSMIISLIRQLVVLIPCAYLIGMLTGDVTGVWWAFVVAEVVSLTVSALYLRRVNRDVIQTL